MLVRTGWMHCTTTCAGTAPPGLPAYLGELFRLNAPCGDGGLRVTVLLRQRRCRLALRLLLRRAGSTDTAVMLAASDGGGNAGNMTLNARLNNATA